MSDVDRGQVATVAATSFGWAATIGVGAVLVTQVLDWDGNALVATLQALTPIGLGLVLAVSVVASLGRAWGLTISSSLVLLGILASAVPLALPGDEAVPAIDSEGMTIAAINLLFDNPVVSEVADDLLVRSPDVISFSEYTFEHRRALGAHPLADRYPHRVEFDEPLGSGMAVWSVYPIVDRGPNIVVARALDVTIDGPDEAIRVVAEHPMTPVSDFDSWRDALDIIGERTSDAATPTVIVGDFNASFWHPSYRELLDRGFTDAHIATGRGWSTSWPTDTPLPPFVRLDHALTDDRLTVTELVDFQPPGSDHRAFVVAVAPVELSPGT